MYHRDPSDPSDPDDPSDPSDLSDPSEHSECSDVYDVFYSPGRYDYSDHLPGLNLMICICRLGLLDIIMLM